MDALYLQWDGLGPPLHSFLDLHSPPLTREPWWHLGLWFQLIHYIKDSSKCLCFPISSVHSSLKKWLQVLWGMIKVFLTIYLSYWRIFPQDDFVFLSVSILWSFDLILDLEIEKRIYILNCSGWKFANSHLFFIYLYKLWKPLLDCHIPCLQVSHSNCGRRFRHLYCHFTIPIKLFAFFASDNKYCHWPLTFQILIIHIDMGQVYNRISNSQCSFPRTPTIELLKHFGNILIRKFYTALVKGWILGPPEKQRGDLRSYSKFINAYSKFTYSKFINTSL